jgi:DNA (cytosine-5)-methyltransferase 1
VEKLKDYLRIKQAAEFLGVAQNTLRAWGQTGRIPEQRHPINGYRLYRREDLERLLLAVAPPQDTNDQQRRRKAR